MTKQSISQKAAEAESYRKAIVDIVGKIKPERLKRIYSLVIYLYLWK